MRPRVPGVPGKADTLKAQPNEQTHSFPSPAGEGGATGRPEGRRLSTGNGAGWGMARCFDPPRFAEKGLAPTAGNTMKDNVNSTYVTVQPTVEEDEERVGNPPRAWRFRPGQSGNPRGRPKRAHGLGAVVARALGERVEATENGRKRRITKLEAAVTQLANSAAKGRSARDAIGPRALPRRSGPLRPGCRRTQPQARRHRGRRTRAAHKKQRAVRRGFPAAAAVLPPPLWGRHSHISNRGGASLPQLRWRRGARDLRDV